MPTRLALVGVLMLVSCGGLRTPTKPAPSSSLVREPVPPPAAEVVPANEPGTASPSARAAERAHALLAQASAALAAGDRAAALRDVDTAAGVLEAGSLADFDPLHASAWVRAALVGLRAGDRAHFEDRLALARTACAGAPAERAAERAALRYELAAAAEESGDLPGAVREAELGLVDALRAHDPDDLALQRARMRTAVHAGRGGDPRRARALQEEALAVLDRTVPADDAVRLKAMEDLAVTRYALGDVAQSTRLSTEALAVREAGADRGRELQAARRNTASILLSAGDAAGARAITARWVADLAARRPPGDADLLEARYVDACVLRQLGQYADCERALTEALDAAPADTAPGDPLRLAMQLERGSARHALGRVEAALVDMEAVLAIRERLLPETDARLLAARNSLAAVKADAGDVLGARRLMELALARGERHFADAHPDLQRSRQNLAAVLLRIGDAAGGRALLEKAIAVRTAQLGPEHRAVLVARVSLANALHREGRNEQAARELESILEAPLSRSPGQERFLAAVYKTLTDVRLGLDDAAGAREAGQHALDLSLRVVAPEHRDAQNARTVLAGALHALGHVEGARALLDEVVQLAAGMPPAEARDITLHALSNLLTLDRELGDAEAIERHAGQLAVHLRPEVRAARLDAPRAVGERARSLSRLLDPAMYAVAQGSAAATAVFEALEMLRGLEAGADLRYGPVPPDLEPLAAHVRSLRRAVPGPGTTVDELERHVRERDELEARLHKDLVARGHVPPEVSVVALAAALKDGEAAVSIRRVQRPRPAIAPGHVRIADPAFLAWVVTPDASLMRIDLGPAEPIEAAVEAWRDALRAGSPAPARGVAVASAPAVANAEPPGSALRQLVLDPVVESLPGVRRLHLALDDVLHMVAFDALPLTDGCVGDRMGVVVASSLARFAADRLGAPARTAAAAPARERMVVLGGADYGAGDAGPVDAQPGRAAGRTRWSTLPGAAEEARAVADLFVRERGGAVRLLTGADAGRAALLEALPSAHWIHLATHGWFAADRGADGAEDPAASLAPLSLCGLALAGANAPTDDAGAEPGVLTAEELAGFDLAECGLAVLSACETSLGVVRGGRAVQSMRVALHAAGARSAITSLWKVDDQATRLFFQEFYARLWRGGETKDQALWNAKSALRAAGHAPRDWAAWVLSGEPD